MAATVLVPELVRPDLVSATGGPDPQRLREAVAGFLARYKTSTRNTYSIGLRQWIAWCQSNGLDPLDARRPHLELYARELEAAGRQRATVVHKLNILAAFYKVVLADGFIDKDPMLGVRRPRIERVSTSKAMSQLQLARVLESAATHGRQDHCIVQMLAFCALRAATLCSIDVENFTNQAGTLVLVVVSKGDKVLTLGIPPATAWLVQQLIDERGTGPLFLNGYGNRLTRANLAVIVRRHVQAAGIRQRITPHSFRHTFVTLARQAHISPEEIMAVTGHADGRMVDYYDRTPALMRSTMTSNRIASQVLAA